MYAAVRPSVDYVVVQDGNRKFIVAGALRESIESKLGRELSIVREMRGEELVG